MHVTSHVVRTRETKVTLMEAKHAVPRGDPKAVCCYEEARDEHALVSAKGTSTVEHYLNIEDIPLACELDQ